jgi:hypothetical protein
MNAHDYYSECLRGNVHTFVFLFSPLSLTKGANCSYLSFVRLDALIGDFPATVSASVYFVKGSSTHAEVSAASELLAFCCVAVTLSAFVSEFVFILVSTSSAV